MAGLPAAAKQFNKVTIHLAGHRFFPLWAVLRHSGRKSGKPYAIPVAVIPTETTVIIALPWGRGTDWVRNVRAAGRCTIRWKGADYECTDPMFVDKDVAAAAARGLVRRALQRMDFPHGFIQLNRRALARGSVAAARVQPLVSELGGHEKSPTAAPQRSPQVARQTRRAFLLGGVPQCPGTSLPSEAACRAHPA